jgi:hypothetical protein
MQVDTRVNNYKLIAIKQLEGRLGKQVAQWAQTWYYCTYTIFFCLKFLDPYNFFLSEIVDLHQCWVGLPTHSTHPWLRACCCPCIDHDSCRDSMQHYCSRISLNVFSVNCNILLVDIMNFCTLSQWVMVLQTDIMNTSFMPHQSLCKTILTHLGLFSFDNLHYCKYVIFCFLPLCTLHVS